MNSVLGFEIGEIDLSVSNITGTILKSTIPITQSVTITLATTSFTMNYNNTGLQTLSFNAGGPFKIASFAPIINAKIESWNIPVTCTFDFKITSLS